MSDELTYTDDVLARLKGWDRCWPGNLNIEVMVDDATVEIAALRARVAELEGVLRSIADDWSGEVEWPGGDEEEAASYASRASAALKE